MGLPILPKNRKYLRCFEGITITGARLKFRVSGWLDDPFCRVDPKVYSVLDRVVKQFEVSGKSVAPHARAYTDPEEASALGLWLVTSAIVQSKPAQTLDDLGSVSAAPETSYREWLDQHARREAIRLKWAEFFDQYDAIIMPISPVSSGPHDQQGNFGVRTLHSDHGDRPYSDLVRWTILTGMAYLPATTPPIGFDVDGLSVSFQIVGPQGGDYTTIALAQRMAELCGGYQPPALS